MHSHEHLAVIVILLLQPLLKCSNNNVIVYWTVNKYRGVDISSSISRVLPTSPRTKVTR